MNDVATFFRDREKGEGETYQLTIDGPKGRHRVSIYAQRPFESRALQDHDVGNAKEVEATFKDLRNGLMTQGGGGLIVDAIDEGGSRTFTVTAVGVKANRPPERCVVLAPGRPPFSMKIDGREASYVAGSHLLVPIDDEAERRLGEFIGQLEYLPPDLQSLVVNAIRRPSLDVRLNRVETEVFRRTADQALAASSARGFAALRHRIGGALRSTFVRAVAVLLLVLLAGANGFLLYRLDNRLHAATVSTSDRGNATNEDTNIAGETGPVPVEPFVVEAKNLFERLRKKQQSDPTLAKIFTSHFDSIAEGELTDERVAEAVAADGESGRQTRAVLWGLIKLQLLAFDPTPADAKFLESADAVTLTNAAYARVKSKVDRDPDASQFLAALACRLRSAETLPFAGDCASVSAMDLETGMQRLSDMVEQRK